MKTFMQIVDEIKNFKNIDFNKKFCEFCLLNFHNESKLIHLSECNVFKLKFPETSLSLKKILLRKNSND